MGGRKMTGQMLSCLMAILLGATSSAAVTDIRKADFLNFTYHSSH
jgi:hypothetical protein